MPPTLPMDNLREALTYAGATTCAPRVLRLAQQEFDAIEDALPRFIAALRSIAEGCSFPSDEVQRAIGKRARTALHGDE